MHDLPAGFKIRPYLDGPGLYIGAEIIACACPANDDPGAWWRLCLYPRRPPRYEFLPDEAACRRYMAAWATKWEAEIRKSCQGEQRSFAHLATSGPSSPSSHPRGRSRRRSGL